MPVLFQTLAEVYGAETCDKPSGLSDGDILVAFVSLFDGAPSLPDAPTGWTRVTNTVNGIDALAIYWRYVATASGEPADYTFTPAVASDYTAIIIARYSGCDPADPWDTQDSTFGQSTGPVTVARDGSMAVFGQGTDTTFSSGAEPSGYTYRTGGDGTFLSDLSVNAGSTGTITAAAIASISAVGIIKAAVASGPTIDTPPSAAHKAVGETATFTVTASATGGGTLSYQWKVGGVNVSTGSGGTTASYTTAALALTDDGNGYTCAVTETGGTSDGTNTSSSATLRVGVIYLGSGAPSYSTAGGGTVAPAYPTVSGGIAAGDQLVCFVALKPPTASPNTGTVTTPTTGGTWNRPAEKTAANDGNTGGYSTTIAADTGNVGAFSFDLIASGSESGTMSITLGGTGGTGNAASVAWAVMLAFRAPPGQTFSAVAGTTGKRTQNTTPAAGSVSEAMAADPGVLAGDYIAFAMAIPTDANGGTTWSSEAVTQTGITYETAAEAAEPFSSVGDDIGGFVAVARALTGTSSAAPVVAATKGGTTTNARGPILFLRLRAVGLSMLALMPWQRRNRNPAYFNM